MINNIGEESDGVAETWCSNERSFPTMKTGFQKFETQLHGRIIRLQ